MVPWPKKQGVLPWYFWWLCWTDATPLIVFLILYISLWCLKQEAFEAVNRMAMFSRAWTNQAFIFTHPEEGTRFLIHVKQRKAVPCAKCEHSTLLSILNVLHIHEHSPVKMSVCLLWLGLSALCKDTQDRFRPSSSHPLFIHLSHLFLTFALICRASGRHTGR